MPLQSPSRPPGILKRSDGLYPPSCRPTAPRIFFQSTEDRYTTLPAAPQTPIPPPEIHITVLPPSYGDSDPPTKVESRSHSEILDLLLKSPVTHLAPQFLKPCFQPIGKRTVLRIPADGSPLQEVSLEILEAPTLPGNTSPIRFPDMTEYYPAATMAQVDYQVMRTMPDEPEEASIGTYIMFKNRSRKVLDPNKHFKDGGVWGDVFIAKVVENATIYWSDGTTSGSMQREVWNNGVAGVMYYDMPWSFIWTPMFSSERDHHVKPSRLVKEILRSRPVDHHDVVELGVDRSKGRVMRMIDDLLDTDDGEELSDDKKIKGNDGKVRNKGKEWASSQTRTQNHVRFQDENQPPKLKTVAHELEDTPSADPNERQQGLIDTTNRPRPEKHTNVQRKVHFVEPIVQKPIQQKSEVDELISNERPIEELVIEDPAIQESAIQEPISKEPEIGTQPANDGIQYQLSRLTDIMISMKTVIDSKFAEDDTKFAMLKEKVDAMVEEPPTEKPALLPDRQSNPLLSQVNGAGAINPLLVRTKGRNARKKKSRHKKRESDTEIDELFFQKPVVEVPTIEEPMVEESIVKESTTDEQTAQEPTVEELIDQEPIIHEPVLQKPEAEKPSNEEPRVEEPILEDPPSPPPLPAWLEAWLDQANIAAPKVEESRIEEPILENPPPAPPLPVIQEPKAEEPASEEARVEEPLPEDPTTTSPLTVIQNRTAEEPPSEPSVEESVPEYPPPTPPLPEDELDPLPRPANGADVQCVRAKPKNFQHGKIYRGSRGRGKKGLKTEGESTVSPKRD